MLIDYLHYVVAGKYQDVPDHSLNSKIGNSFEQEKIIEFMNLYYFLYNKIKKMYKYVHY